MGKSGVNSAPHFIRKKLRSGVVWYVYAWRGGPQILRSDGPNKPKLRAADWVKIAEAERTVCSASTDLVGGSLTQFRRSSYWRDLSSGTKATWGYALDKIEKKWGDAPVALFSDPRMKPKIVKWRNEMSATPRMADISILVLSRWLNWAMLEGFVLINPAIGIPTIDRPFSRAAVVWLPADLDAINSTASEPLRDAIKLARLTGMRRADLVALKWSEVGDVAIHRTALKMSHGKRYQITVPRLPEIDNLLIELRSRPRKDGVDTVLVNANGQAWTGSGLNSSFSNARKRANNGTGIWHVEHQPDGGEVHRTQKRLHDLRGTYATYLIAHPTANLTNQEIAVIMGWSPEQVDQIRKRYVDDNAIVVSIARRLAGKM